MKVKLLLSIADYFSNFRDKRTIYIFLSQFNLRSILTTIAFQQRRSTISVDLFLLFYSNIRNEISTPNKTNAAFIFTI